MVTAVGLKRSVTATITPDRARRFAALFGCPGTDGDRYAHPCLVVVPLTQLFADMVAVLHERVGEALVLHAEQRLDFFEPLPIGETLEAAASVTREGSYGTGCGLAVSLTARAFGNLVATGSAVVALVGPQAGSKAVTAVPRWKVALGPLLASSQFTVASEVVAAYAELSGDLNPIHLSDEAAQAVGLPSAVGPGMLTLAACASGAIKHFGDGSYRSLASIGMRFTRPLPVGACLQLSYFSTPSPSIVAVQARNVQPVTRNGFVEIRRRHNGFGRLTRPHSATT